MGATTANWLSGSQKRASFFQQVVSKRSNYERTRNLRGYQRLEALEAVFSA